MVYDFLLWGGHKVNAYYWNTGPGCMVTYNLTHVPLTVLAQDQFSNPLATGDVYLDDELAGFTNSTFVVEAGTYEIFVNDFWETNNTGYRYCFKNWTDGSAANPRNVTVTEDTTITANFIKNHWPGDVTGDAKVRVDDVLFVAILFGSDRGDDNWDSRADVIYDSQIRVDDQLEVASHFGATY